MSKEISFYKLGTGWMLHIINGMYKMHISVDTIEQLVFVMWLFQPDINKAKLTQFIEGLDRGT